MKLLEDESLAAETCKWRGALSRRHDDLRPLLEMIGSRPGMSFMWQAHEGTSDTGRDRVSGIQRTVHGSTVRVETPQAPRRDGRDRWRTGIVIGVAVDLGGLGVAVGLPLHLGVVHDKAIENIPAVGRRRRARRHGVIIAIRNLKPER